METKCSKCLPGSELMNELQHILQDGDPLRLMEILMDMISHERAREMLTPGDFSELNNLNHLLAAMTRQQQSN